MPSAFVAERLVGRFWDKEVGVAKLPTFSQWEKLATAVKHVLHKASADFSNRHAVELASIRQAQGDAMTQLTKCTSSGIVCELNTIGCSVVVKLQELESATFSVKKVNKKPARLLL